MITEKEKGQILKWIGSPNLQLVLITSSDSTSLSQITSVPTVNTQQSGQSEDTVIVARNEQNWVFGGYNAQLLPQVLGAKASDRRSFLFRLRKKGNQAMEKFPALYPTEQSIYRAIELGYDMDVHVGSEILIANNQAIAQQIGAFLHQPQTPYGGYYQSRQSCMRQGTMPATCQTANELMGSPNQCNITELFVYKVEVCAKKADPSTPAKPWRKVVDKWNQKVVDAIKAEVSKYRPPTATGLQCANVLLVGPTGSGKSSFFNTVNSTYRGYVTSQAAAGYAEHGLTTRFRRYEVKSRTGSEDQLCVRLCDTLGVSEKQSIRVGDVAYLMDGNIPNHFQFNTLSPVTPDTSGFVANPGWDDKMHVVALVLSAKEVESMSDKLCEMLIAIKTEAHARGIPLAVLLTHMDEVLEEPGDLSTVFLSKAVLEAVAQAASRLGVPRSHVLPVQNYESETELEVQVDLLALVALRQLLRLADAYFEDQMDAKGGAAAHSSKMPSSCSADKLDQPY